MPRHAFASIHVTNLHNAISANLRASNTVFQNTRSWQNLQTAVWLTLHTSLCHPGMVPSQSSSAVIGFRRSTWLKSLIRIADDIVVGSCARFVKESISVPRLGDLKFQRYENTVRHSPNRGNVNVVPHTIVSKTRINRGSWIFHLYNTITCSHIFETPPHSLRLKRMSARLSLFFKKPA